MPDATWAESTTVVETKPRTREEVREELREEIRLLEMPRIPVQQKEQLEREAVDSSVGEVELFERSWRKTTPETIAEIERRVDELGTGALPRAAELAANARSTPAPAAGPAPVRTSGVDFTPAPPHLPTRTGRPLTSKLTPAEQRAIAKHLGGTLTKVTVVFTTSRGRVVDVEYKKGSEELATTVIVDAEGEVATLDAIGQKLDSMPLPSSAAPAQERPVSRVEEALGPGPRPAPPAPAARERPAKRTATVLASGRTQAGLLPTLADQDIERVEGIGPVFAQKLRRAGVEIIEDICLCDADKVARETGISPELVRKWQDMGRLQAVNGIGPQYSELLVRAGVRTMDQLARQEPLALARQLNAYEDSLGVRVQGTVIQPTQTEEWVKQAKELTQAAPAAAHGAAGPGPHAKVEAAHTKKKAKAPPPAPPKKGFGGLPFGRKAEPVEAPKDDAPAEGEDKPKRKFGLPFGKK